MKGITAYFTDAEVAALRAYDAQDVSPEWWQVVWEACREALPKPLEVGAYVQPIGTRDSYYPAEVILVREDRVYAIDKDGDSCDFGLDEVEVVA